MAQASKARTAFVPPRPVKAKARIGASLGLKSTDVSTLIHAAQAGLTWTAVRKFLEATGLSQQQLATYLNVPERTFARRRETGAFERTESEKLLRLAEIWDAALDLFDGDGTRTLSWILTPAFGLGNVSPIDYAQTEFGGREVRALIGRLADGVFS